MCEKLASELYFQICCKATVHKLIALALSSEVANTFIINLYTEIFVAKNNFQHIHCQIWISASCYRSLRLFPWWQNCFPHRDNWLSTPMEIITLTNKVWTADRLARRNLPRNTVLSVLQDSAGNRSPPSRGLPLCQMCVENGGILDCLCWGQPMRMATFWYHWWLVACHGGTA